MASPSPTTYSLIALEKELEDIEPSSIKSLFTKVKTDLQSGNDDAVKTSANDLKNKIDTKTKGNKGLSEHGVTFLNKLRTLGNLQEADTMDAKTGKPTVTPTEDKAKIQESFQSGSNKPGSSEQQVGSRTVRSNKDHRAPDPVQQNKMATTLQATSVSSAQQMIDDSREIDSSRDVLLVLQKCLSAKHFVLSDAIKDLPKQQFGLEIINEVNQLKEENKRLTAGNDNQIATLEEQLKTSKSTIEKLATMEEQLKTAMSTIKKLATMEEQLKTAKSTIESNKSTIESNKSTIESNKSNIERLEKEKKDEEDKNKKMLADTAAERADMEKKFNDFSHEQNNTIEKHKVSIDQLQATKNQLQTEKGQLQTSIAKVEDKLRKARKETEGWQNQFQQVTEDYNRQQQKNSEDMRRLHGENKQLKSRVSELAGAKLMDNNPDIADLSDPNRALKLGEKFSSLYDDDWTDAFQSYTEKFKMKEDDAIQKLLHVLMKTYEFCRKVADEQMDCLCNVFDNPCQDIPTALPMKPQKEKAHISQKQYKDLKDLRKQIALKKTDSITKQYISTEYEEVKKGDKKLKSVLDETRSYYEKCVEVCWPMVLHDPPVRMDPDIKPGVKIDPNRFRLYGGNGDILEYLVWPPLLVEGGGFLAKGVAKPKKVPRVVKKP